MIVVDIAKDILANPTAERDDAKSGKLEQGILGRRWRREGVCSTETCRLSVSNFQIPVRPRYSK